MAGALILAITTAVASAGLSLLVAYFTARYQIKHGLAQSYDDARAEIAAAFNDVKCYSQEAREDGKLTKVERQNLLDGISVLRNTMIRQSGNLRNYDLPALQARVTELDRLWKAVRPGTIARAKAGAIEALEQDITADLPA